MRTSTGVKDGEVEKSLAFVHYTSKFPELVFICVSVSIACYYIIPLEDVAFSILFPVYLFTANALRFQSNAPARNSGNPIDLSLLKEDGKDEWFPKYMGTFAMAGLLLPASTLLLAEPSVAAKAAPHLFVLLAQIVVECIMVGNTGCYNLIRILVPIGFSAYREKCLVAWVFASWKDYQQQQDFWCAWGLGLAVVILLLWSYNLFVFLLLRMTPQFLDPTESPAAPVEWKGQLIPVLKTNTEKKKE